MNLKTFNATNVSFSKKETKPFVSLASKSGLFNFNKAACEIIGLKAGNQIQFHQDEDDEQVWYLEVVPENGFTVREKKNVTAGLIFNNACMVRKIFDSMSYIEKSGRVLIGEVIEIKKQRLITLVTARLKNK